MACTRPWAGRGVLLLVILSAGGCAQLDRLKARVGSHFGHQESVATTPVKAVPAPAPAEAAPDRSLSQILNEQLQRGHYAQGQAQLEQYLRRHPGDRAAQALLHQLTVDPRTALGERSRSYRVRPGDSYSTLAARFLHDASLFVLLARYNDAANPSVLQVGQKLRMPLASDGSADGSAPAPSAPVTEMTVQSTAVTDASLAKAARLQQESLALLNQGHQTQALARLDEALQIDPGLAAPGITPVSRQKLVATLHERAIVLYRDQQLDQAIALWDRVLAIDPGYERAVVYRTRAMELKRRLRQL